MVKFPSDFDFLVFLMIRFRWSLWGWSPKWCVCQHVRSRCRISTWPALRTLTLATWLRGYCQTSSLWSYSFWSYYFSLCNSPTPFGETLGDCTDPCYSAALTHPLVLWAWVCDWDVGTGQCGLRLSFSLHSLVGFLLHRTSLSSFLSTHLVDSYFIHWVIILLLSILVPILPLHAGSSGRSPTL